MPKTNPLVTANAALYNGAVSEPPVFADRVLGHLRNMGGVQAYIHNPLFLRGTYLTLDSIMPDNVKITRAGIQPDGSPDLDAKVQNVTDLARNLMHGHCTFDEFVNAVRVEQARHPDHVSTPHFKQSVRRSVHRQHMRQLAKDLERTKAIAKLAEAHAAKLEKLLKQVNAADPTRPVP